MEQVHSIGDLILPLQAQQGGMPKVRLNGRAVRAS
jgi:hypothetical protein